MPINNNNNQQNDNAVNNDNNVNPVNDANDAVNEEIMDNFSQNFMYSGICVVKRRLFLKSIVCEKVFKSLFAPCIERKKHP